jgi:hypothetical protein
MFGILKKYRDVMKNDHGWESPLECPRCATIAVPKYRDWTPSQSIKLGNDATIFANLNCSRCDADLKDTARRALVELFSGVEIPESNRRLLRWYVSYTISSTLLLAGGIALARWAGWNLKLLLPILIIPVVLARPFGQWLSYAVAAHRLHCSCGKPAYKFMGLLGRTGCNRCSNCGNLLRLRD